MFRRLQHNDFMTVHPNGHWSIHVGEAFSQVGGIPDSATYGQTGLGCPSFTDWDSYKWYAYDVDFYNTGKWFDSSEEVPHEFDIIAYKTALGYEYTTHRDVLVASRPGAVFKSFKVSYAHSGVWFFKVVPTPEA